MKTEVSTMIVIAILMFGLGMVIGEFINKQNPKYVCRDGNLYEKVSSIILKDLKTHCIFEME